MLSAHAQQDPFVGKIDYIEPAVDPSGTLEEISLPPPDYKGSIYENDLFQTGRVYFNSKVYQAELRLNLHDEIVEMKSYGKLYRLPFSMVKKITLSDSTLYEIANNQLREIIFQDGSIKLFRSIILDVQNPTYDARLNIGDPDIHFKIKKECMIEINGKLYPLKKRKHIKQLFHEIGITEDYKKYGSMDDPALIDLAKTISKN